MSSFIGLEETTGKKKKNLDGGLNAIFGIPDAGFEIIDVSIEDLVPYKNHKFRPSSEAKREMIKESIQEFGVLEPVIVRPKKDIPYDIAGKYEILAGHQRTELSRELGNTSVPVIIKTGLSEDEAEQIVAETNMQRSFEEMTHSERAAVLSSHYNAQKRRNVRKEVLEEINSYLQTYASPVNTKAEEGLSQIATNGIRGVAEACNLSKDMIARYIRVDTLNEKVKLLLDDGELALMAAVELSYISPENQDMLVDLMNTNHYKCNINKAKLIRELQTKNQLTEDTMSGVLSGSVNKKKPGKPKGYKVSGKIIQKYFSNGVDDKQIGEIIEEALKMYFGVM